MTEKSKALGAQHGDVWAALVAASQEFTTVQKSGYNGHLKSHYATLQDLVAATKPALLAHGLYFYQAPTYRWHVSEDAAPEGLYLKCTIRHAASATEVAELVPLRGENSDQKHGAEISYKKRYSYAAMLWLVDGLEDDGESTKGNGGTNGGGGTQPPAKKPAKPPAKPPAKQPTPAHQQPTVATEAAVMALVPDGVGLTKDEVNMIIGWHSGTGAAAAQEWALAIAACQNEIEAKNSFAKVVREQMGGELKTSTMLQALVLFFLRQVEKLANAEPAHAQAVVASEDIPF